MEYRRQRYPPQIERLILPHPIPYGLDCFIYPPRSSTLARMSSIRLSLSKTIAWSGGATSGPSLFSDRETFGMVSRLHDVVCTDVVMGIVKCVLEGSMALEALGRIVMDGNTIFGTSTFQACKTRTTCCFSVSIHHRKMGSSE